MKKIVESLLLGVVSAFQEMRVQPLRSTLSIVGVALAVGALTALLAIIGGLNAMVREAVSDMGGAGRITVTSVEATEPADRVPFSRSPGLRSRDAALVDSLLPGRFQALQTAGGWAEAMYLGSPTRVYLMGSDRDYLVRDVGIEMTSGALPDSADFARGALQVVVGQSVGAEWDSLATLKGRPLLGSTVALGGVPYEVVGTFQYKHANWGRNAVTVVIPWAAYEKRHQAVGASLSSVQMRVADPESTNVWIEGLTAVLTGNHRGASDFTFQLFEFLSTLTTMIGNIAMLFGVVAALSLSVGALGIFNTMLAGFHDRIHEIGVRKALGARRLQILMQFLAESLVLSSLGGIAGICIGGLPVLFGDLIKSTANLKPTLDAGAVAEAFLVSLLVGILAGLWPAIKASRIDPVDALRYE